MNGVNVFNGVNILNGCLTTGVDSLSTSARFLLTTVLKELTNNIIEGKNLFKAWDGPWEDWMTFPNLKSANIRPATTNRITDSMFNGSGLSGELDIEFPELIDAEAMFINCAKLEKVNIRLPKATNIGWGGQIAGIGGPSGMFYRVHFFKRSIYRCSGCELYNKSMCRL